MIKLNTEIKLALKLIDSSLEEVDVERKRIIKGVSKLTRKKAAEVLKNPESEKVAERIDRLVLFQTLLRNIRINLALLENREKPLRVNQLESIHKLIDFLKNEGYGELSGYIRQPTGAGKTFLFGVIADLCDVPTLVLVPKVNLLTQTKKEFIKSVGISEESIGLMGGKKKEAGKKITIATYQTHLSKMKTDDSYRDLVEKCQLIICDEAHRSLGDKTRESIDMIDAGYDDLLTIEEQKAENEVFTNLKEHTPARALKIGFTATPELKSKHVEDAFGKLIAEEKHANLIKLGYLVPYKIIQSDGKVTKKDLEGYMSEDKEVQILRREKTYEKLIGKYMDVLEKYHHTKRKGEYPLRGVAFCVKIEECDRFAKEAEKMGLRTRVITSRETKGLNQDEHDKFLREAEQELLDQEIDLIITVTKLSEGWDFPPANAAIWARATQSPALIIQGVGRTARSYEDEQKRKKKCSHVFETNWKLQGTFKSKKPMKITEALLRNGEDPEEICSMADNSKLEYDEDISTHDRKWNAMLEEVLNFKEKNNYHPKHDSKNKNELKLYNWINTQNICYRDGKLSEDRVNRLIKAGLIRTREAVMEERWDMYLNGVRNLINDGIKLDTKSKNKEIRKLAYWLAGQRTEYRKNLLPLQRKMKLEEAGLIQGYAKSDNTLWEESLNAINLFIKKRKSPPLSTSKDSEEKKLSTWLMHQKTLFRKGTLRGDRLEKLKAAKIFDEEKILKSDWDGILERILKWKSDNQNSWPNKNTNDSDEKYFAYWLSMQRAAYNKNELDKEKISQLEKIGFIWDVKDNAWQENFGELKHFKNENKRWPIFGAKDETENKLAHWMNRQRQSYRLGSLKEQRIVELEKIRFLWEART